MSRRTASKNTPNCFQAKAEVAASRNYATRNTDWMLDIIYTDAERQAIRDAFGCAERRAAAERAATLKAA